MSQPTALPPTDNANTRTVAMEEQRKTVRVISREIFLPAPSPESGVMAYTAYTHLDGEALVCRYSYISRSDTTDKAYQRFSSDGGQTWSAPEPIITGEKRAEGTFRRNLRCMVVEPGSGRFVSFRVEGVLPTDYPLEGMKQWAIYYSVSEDGGRSYVTDEQIVVNGDEYTPEHPLPGIYRGKSSYMLGDLTCMPLTLPDGTILLPCQVTPTDEQGNYKNLGGGATYHDAMVLRGRWQADKRIAWEASARVVGDPQQTTRGLIEPTLGMLADGSVLMVMRGSNDVKPALPGYRWFSRSTDGGCTWTKATPWTYTDGQPFYSPSSCSQLLQHSSGALFWIGNIAPENPKGNSPRYPLVIAQVDRKSGLLLRDTVTVIDTRGQDEDVKMTLSNFSAREERKTGNILLYMSRLGADKKSFWHADALLYRLAVE